jgi:hypothetical protein
VPGSSESVPQLLTVDSFEYQISFNNYKYLLPTLPYLIRSS